MLLFAPLPTGADAPQLSGITLFPDHRESRLVYYLPQALELLPTVSGDPDFFLLRYHGDFTTTQGGLLRFRLGFSPLPQSKHQAATSAGWQLYQTGFEAARFRYRLRSLVEAQPDQLSDWHPLVSAGHELVAPAVSLNTHETQCLESLLADAYSAVEVELDLRYSGLVPGSPCLISAYTAQLKALLTAQLPNQPVRSDQIIAAFLSMPTSDGSPFTFQSLDGKSPTSNSDTLLTEIALRSLDILFKRQLQADDFAPVTYLLIPSTPTDPPSLSWNLLPPRKETRTYALTWSVGPLVQSLNTLEKRNKLFPIVSQVSPFSNIKIHVINRLPFDLRFLQKAVVDLRYSGASGVPEFRSFTFNGASDLQTFSTFYQAVTRFQLDCRITTTLAPPDGKGWPVVRKGDYVSVNGSVVEINRAAVGMDFARVEAEPEVFHKAASITVKLFSSDPSDEQTAGLPLQPLIQLVLNSTYAASWVALPGIASTQNLFFQVTAYALGQEESAPVTLSLGQLASRQLRIAAYQLECLDPDRITIELNPQTSGNFALVQVTVTSLSGDERTYTLQPAHPVVWNLFRNSVFETLRYRYRLNYVVIDTQGRTMPMVSTDWMVAEETTLIVSPPLNNKEICP